MKINKIAATPKISVIMPIYNVEKYLRQAVDSILNQTYSDFELIAINDGSPDNSLKILREYESRDTRLRIVNQENIGLVATLNKGIGLARGTYIARMDPDDISFPNRFELQVRLLEEQHDVVLVAGAFEVIDEDGEFIYREVLPAHDHEIKRSMLLRNPIAHGSVMFRKETFEKIGEYSSTCGPMEDFYLWTQMAKLGKFEATESVVYSWRVNTSGITSTKNKEVQKATKEHLENVWKENFPSVVDSTKLRNDGLHYFRKHKKRGKEMKDIVWGDNAQIAVKMIRHGAYIDGLKQLVNLALTGRAGIRAVKKRLSHISTGSRHAVVRYATKKVVRKNAKYGRNEI